MPSFYKAFFGLILLQANLSFSQGKLVMNGADMIMQDSAFFITSDVSLTSGSSLFVNNSTIKIAGGIVNPGGVFDVTKGTVEMIGKSLQIIPAQAFTANTIKNLIISNDVRLSGQDTLTGLLSFGPVDSKVFRTVGYLTLKSNAAGTASVADITNNSQSTGNQILGKVTVERYIANRKAWRLLAVPTNTTQTINEAWQEGASGTSSNPVAGYGIQLSSDRSSWASDGFDLYSAGGPSMKLYNSATNNFTGVTSTASPIATTAGYFVFIRGDRTINTYNAAPVETVLRTKGPLYTGDQPDISVLADKFATVGNPYAAAIDMRHITKTGLKDFFYIWDPKLGGTYGYGAYQTFSNDGNGNYVVTPGDGSYEASGSISNYIASGQAFLVQGNSTGGSISFEESDKSTGTTGQQVSRFTSGAKPWLRTNLYGVNPDNSTYMADGVLVNYDDSYSNRVDEMDAIKSTNTSENLSLKTDNTLLVIERRHSIVQKDTVFLNLAKVKAQRYHFEFITSRLSQAGLAGFIEDNYLHTSTPLNMNGSTSLDFTVVNIAGSYANNRFQIVFNQLGTLPVTLTSLKAYQQASHINVDWKTENESNIQQYKVEKSADGKQFTQLAVAKPVANGGQAAAYSTTDASPLQGYNYYRIASVDINAKTAYSNIVRVKLEKDIRAITVYPNPVTNNIIKVQLLNQPAGLYTIKLLNNIGQQVLETSIQHAEGTSEESIPLERNMPKGMYQLQVIQPDFTVITNKLIY